MSKMKDHRRMYPVEAVSLHGDSMDIQHDRPQREPPSISLRRTLLYSLSRPPPADVG
jgi:hypothetical protein